MRVREVWAGGQTGVDRAALDVAMALHISTRGWVPRGRRAEDGTIPLSYRGLQETTSTDYAERTTWNVRDTDATLILYRETLSGGSAFTHDEALRLRRPVLVLDLGSAAPHNAVARIRSWLNGVAGSRLNVAGPRASSDPAIYADAMAVLFEALVPSTGEV
jgi:hypothetical protein